MDGVGRIRFGSMTGGEAAAEDGQRAKKRDSLFLSARLRIADNPTVHDVRVRNLSAGGLMAELARAVETDTPVTLELRGLGELTGKIAWSTHGRIGIALDHPIDPARARKPVGKGRTTPAFAKPLIVNLRPR
ncbi:PilZ domain-containing protein [Sphingomonas sp.]|uniref:PilZ domain-containing protein n=1 Tax=Sphingomonas sp. TaxID=28214 RepID=UPI003CC590E7